MDVIDQGPQTWFLLRDGEALLIDARCSHGAVDDSMLSELDADERAAWEGQGHGYLDRLAEAIHGSAPGVPGSTSRYKDRKVDGVRGRDAHAAIMRWLEHEARRLRGA